MGLGVLVDQLEREELDVGLDGLVSELAPNETLGIEDSVLGVGCQLVLGGISDQPLAISSEGNIAGSDTVALVVGNDLNAAVLEHSNAGKSSLDGSFDFLAIYKVPSKGQGHTSALNLHLKVTKRLTTGCRKESAETI